MLYLNFNVSPKSVSSSKFHLNLLKVYMTLNTWYFNTSLLSYRPCKWRYFICPSFYISVYSLFLSNEFLFSFFRFITPLYLRAISSILLDTSLEGNIAVNKLSVYTANSITASPEGSSRLVIFIELGGITSLSVKGDGIPVGKKNEMIHLFFYYNNHFLCIIHIRWTSIKKGNT